jgi:5'-3' exonuclease
MDNPNYIFVDGSYFIFYRYYALKRWFTFKYKEKIDKDGNVINFEDLFSNVEFREKFLKYDEYLTKFIKNFSIEKPKVVFAKDCPRNEIWRNDIYPDYKKSRKKDVEVGQAFKCFYENITHKFISKDHLEADDMIAKEVMKLDKTNKYKNIYIITGDHDYLQLKYNENIHIYNLKYLDLSTKGLGDYKKDLEYKIILGDKSDNILAIHPKCGPKTALKYVENPDYLQEVFNKNPEYKKNYELNKRLIDFRELIH